MTQEEIKDIAPNLHLMLWRPIYSTPQIYSLADMRGKSAWVTIRDVFDANEALDLLDAQRAKDEEAMRNV